MPASVALQQITYRPPDGRSLFDNLDLSFGPVRTGLVGRNGVGKSTLLALIAGAREPAGGFVHVEGTMGMLRQSVQVNDAATVADSIGIAEALARLDRLEAGTGSLEDAAEADWVLPQRVDEVLAEVGLSGIEPARPVATLSGGQRTRLSLAGLLLMAPDMILLDEPTNNLDAEGRAAVAEVLARWRGGAIMVSHDRTLLRQMDVIVELTSLGATSYGGNYDDYRARKQVELEAAQRTLDDAERHLADIERRVQAQAERKARKDSAGKRRAKKGGMPRILLGGMKRRAEATAGNQSLLGTRMREEAGSELAEARGKIEVLQPVSVTLPPTGLPAGRRVLDVRGLSGGPDGLRLIDDCNLVITGPERVAISGPNGSGKTTLLRLISGELPPSGGTVARGARMALLDQTVSLLDPTHSIRDNYRRLNPTEDENACRAALARFKFRAEAALQIVGTLSGGEMLRAGLAATIGSTNPPEQLILDEPTTHHDLDANAAVEHGLRSYDGALLVVSHDRAFLEAIGIEREIVLPARGG